MLKLSLYVLAPLPIMSITIFFISKIIHSKAKKYKTIIYNFKCHSGIIFWNKNFKIIYQEKINFDNFKSETNEYLETKCFIS